MVDMVGVLRKNESGPEVMLPVGSGGGGPQMMMRVGGKGGEGYKPKTSRGQLGAGIGAGLSGAFAGLQGLMAVNRAGTSGQDAISGLSGAGLQALSSYQTTNPMARRLGGQLGDYRRPTKPVAVSQRTTGPPTEQQRREAQLRRNVAGPTGPRVGVTAQQYPMQTPFAYESPKNLRFQSEQFANELNERQRANEMLEAQNQPLLSSKITPISGSPVPVHSPISPDFVSQTLEGASPTKVGVQRTGAVTPAAPAPAAPAPAAPAPAAPASAPAGQSTYHQFQQPAASAASNTNMLGDLAEQAKRGQNAAGGSSSSTDGA
tara:strand:+ start:1105 stop:2058 length:954 start_codon:yes stop_codon:yes gene_type:complete